MRLQCVLVGTHVVRSPQSFTWTGPGLNNGHATVQHSNTVSTLTINSVRDEDKGQYSCSYPGLPTVSITVEVIGTLFRQS